MAALDFEKRERGLEYAKRLQLLASEAPDAYTGGQTNSLVRTLQSHYGYNEATKRRAILQMIDQSGGWTTVPDIVQKFRWHKDAVARLVGEMELSGDIEFYNAPPAGPGPGRRARRIRRCER